MELVHKLLKEARLEMGDVNGDVGRCFKFVQIL
jgi:hypothetical protein